MLLECRGGSTLLQRRRTSLVKELRETSLCLHFVVISILYLLLLGLLETLGALCAFRSLNLLREAPGHCWEAPTLCGVPRPLCIGLVNAFKVTS